MVKLIGSVMFVMAATGLGFWKSACYSERTRELNQLLTALQMLETEISYGATPLPEAFGRIGARISGNIGLLLTDTGNAFKQGDGLSAGQIFRQQIARWSPDLHLKAQDIDILHTFGETLGSSDRSNQIKHIRLACQRLAAEETSARDERDRLGKMWKYLGALTGLAAVIIMY